MRIAFNLTFYSHTTLKRWVFFPTTESLLTVVRFFRAFMQLREHHYMQISCAVKTLGNLWLFSIYSSFKAILHAPYVSDLPPSFHWCLTPGTMRAIPKAPVCVYEFVSFAVLQFKTASFHFQFLDRGRHSWLWNLLVFAGSYSPIYLMYLCSAFFSPLIKCIFLF